MNQYELKMDEMAEVALDEIDKENDIEDLMKKIFGDDDDDDDMDSDEPDNQCQEIEDM